MRSPPKKLLTFNGFEVSWWPDGHCLNDFQPLEPRVIFALFFASFRVKGRVFSRLIHRRRSWRREIQSKNRQSDSVAIVPALCEGESAIGGVARRVMIWIQRPILGRRVQSCDDTAGVGKGGQQSTSIGDSAEGAVRVPLAEPNRFRARGLRVILLRRARPRLGC